jgi:Na+/melibiose symporter-like transporter
LIFQSVIPVLSAAHALHLGWIYGIMFVQACFQVVFSAGEFTAVVALADEGSLVRANGIISASYSAATVAGTALAGLTFAVAPIADALWVDGASFLASAASLAAIRRSFNKEPPPGLRGVSLRSTVADLMTDTKAGLRYVWQHALLRNLSLQLVVVNLFGSAATSQEALFAIRRLGADNSQVGYLMAASSVGVVVLSLVVGPLSSRVPLGSMVLVALVVYGGGYAVLGFVTSYAAALALWACIGGATVLYNVSTTSLRQRLVPNELLGRVSNVAISFAWCVIPVGSLAGGAIISATGRVDVVYISVGVTIAVTALVFNRSVLKDANGLGK